LVGGFGWWVWLVGLVGGFGWWVWLVGLVGGFGWWVWLVGLVGDGDAQTTYRNEECTCKEAESMQSFFDFETLGQSSHHTSSWGLKPFTFSWGS
jgi:hypothetical protein